MAPIDGGGWTTVDVAVSSDEIPAGQPFAVAVRSADNGMGYDEDSSGEGKSFKEDPTGIFRDLSGFERVPSGEKLTGSWLIRATVRERIDVVTPDTYELAQNVPNPFGNPGNSRTFIRYTLKDDGYTTLKVYDIQGHLVTTLVEGPRTTGTYTALWDGRNDGGRLVASGVYIYRLESGSRSRLVGKMAFVK